MGWAERVGVIGYSVGKTLAHELTRGRLEDTVEAPQGRRHPESKELCPRGLTLKKNSSPQHTGTATIRPPIYFRRDAKTRLHLDDIVSRCPVQAARGLVQKSQRLLHHHLLSDGRPPFLATGQPTLQDCAHHILANLAQPEPLDHLYHT